MTEPTAQILPLAADFPPATRAQWLELVSKLLKGAPFERKLVAKTRDGLTIQPLYSGMTTERPPVGRTDAGAWAILQRVDHPDPAAANAEARHDCENGATALSLVLAGAVGAYGFGLTPSEAAIGRALDGLALDAPGLALEIDAGACGEAAAEVIAALAEQRGIAERASIRFGLDPLGAVAMTTTAGQPWKEAGAAFGQCVAKLMQSGFRGPLAVADGRIIHNAGGSEAQELGFVLAVAVSYLRALGAKRDCARSRARAHLLSPQRRRRSVPDHCQVPRATPSLGACRSGLRARTCADLHQRRERLAHDDRPRSLCEHAAGDHCGVLGRPSAVPMPSRCCHLRCHAACRTASRDGSRAIRSSCLPRNPILRW